MAESEWTLQAYVVHNEALRRAEDKFQSERDRRYTEVKNAEEKALRIKEQADRDALQLAREIQTYKDEKANELREQISRERGEYVTQEQLKGVSDKIEATMKPVLDFVSSQQGRTSGRLSQQQFLFALIGAIATLIVIGLFVFKR
jgi:vacuolar-type H+-ATPase subunit H